jgi:hypothetical protein
MKHILSIILCLVPSLAFAQGSPIIQSGQLTPGRALMGIANGVAGDAGPALGGSLKELGITATGTPFCIGDAAISGPYHQLCLGANSLGGGLISYDNHGGATPLPLEICVNSTCTQLPFTTTGVQGLSPTVVGDVAAWGNTGGTLIGEGPPLRLNIPTGAQTLSFLPTGNPLTSLGSLNIHANSVSGSTREYLTNIGFDVATGVGAGSSGSGDKVGMYIGVVSASGNGNLWAINPLITISAGSSQGQYQVSELDMNNNSAAPPTTPGPSGILFGGPTAPGNTDPPPNGTSGGTYAYGDIVECSGSFPCTAGLLIAGANAWQRGIGCFNNVSEACFYDYTNSSKSIDIWGMHRHTIDLSNAIQTVDIDATSLLLPASGNISAMSVVHPGTQFLVLVGDANDHLHLAEGESGGPFGWASVEIDAPLTALSGISTGSLPLLNSSSVNTEAYFVSNVPGVTCSGAPSGSFTVTAGIITHC